MTAIIIDMGNHDGYIVRKQYIDNVKHTVISCPQYYKKLVNDYKYFIRNYSNNRE